MKRVWQEVRLSTYLALLTVFVSNFSFFPFGTGFRFSLAVPAFCFFLLLNDKMRWPVAGLTTGLAVVVFRAGTDLLLTDLAMWHGIERHLPAGVFYLLLGSGMALVRHALLRGGLDVIWILAFLDLGSNIGELIVRGGFINRDVAPMLYLLAVVALVRGTLTGLAFTAWQQHAVITRQEQEQREFQRLLVLTSDVSGELLYLEHTLATVERVMAQSHQLYSQLKGENSAGTETALAVAREIHDAKKDLVRLAARLRHSVTKESGNTAVGLPTLVEVAVAANRSLASEQGKNITVHAQLEGQAEVVAYHRVLAIINNLMANAIDAIAQSGEVWLQVSTLEDNLLISVRDTGSGINQEDLELVFEPGFTTKFNQTTGQASTGLGLAQVKAIASSLGGAITVRSQPGKGSIFSVEMPLPRGE